MTTELITLPAAVVAPHAAPRMSERYEFIDTRQIISRMASEGFHVASAKCAQPKKRDPLYAKHIVDFRHEDAREVNGAVPRIIFTNSHDGSSSAAAMGGVYRFVCSNGLVIGNTVGKERARHQGDPAADLIVRMQQLARNTQETFDKIDRWTRISLNQHKAQRFAHYAAQLRWGDAHRFGPQELLKIRRSEDDAGDLWTVFNRVQENTIRGGLEGLSRTGRRATSRPLADITRDTQYNAALWALAEEVATSW